MRLFSFYTNGDDVVSLVPSDLDYFDGHFVGKPMGPFWTPPPFKVLRKSKPVLDFVSWFGSEVVVSECGKQHLEPLLKQHAEFLPFAIIKKKKYFAINVLEVVDCLDRHASRVTYSQDDPDRIIHIQRFVFHEKNLRAVPIFKVPETFSEIFVSESFAQAVVDAKLTGAGFDNPEDIRYVKEPWDGTMEGLPNARDFTF